MYNIGVLRYLVVAGGNAVDELEQARQNAGLTQMGMDRNAGFPGNGHNWRRMKRAKDARLSVFVRFANALGYDVILAERGKPE